MLAKPPTEKALMTYSAPSSPESRSVVAVTESPIPGRHLAMCAPTSSILGSESASTSTSVTSASWSDSVLAKSDSSRGVQCELPPPTMVIRGVMGASGREVTGHHEIASGRSPGVVNGLEQWLVVGMAADVLGDEWALRYDGQP